jgi:topoisomerase IA-like protein
MWNKLKNWLFPEEIKYTSLLLDEPERRVTVVKKTAKKPAAKKKTPSKKSPAKKTAPKKTVKKTKKK